MSKGNTFEDDLLKLIFNATPIADVADDDQSSPATTLSVALILSADGVAIGTATGLGIAPPWGANNWRGRAWIRHPLANWPKDGELR